MSGSRGTGAPGARARPRRDAAPASCPLPCPLPGLPPRSRPCPPGCFRVYINKLLAAAGFRVLNKLRARARAQPGLHSRPQDRAVRGTSPPLNGMPGRCRIPRSSSGSPPPLGTSVSRRTPSPRRNSVPLKQPRRLRPNLGTAGHRKASATASAGLCGCSGPERRAGGAGAASWTRRRASQLVPWFLFSVVRSPQPKEVPWVLLFPCTRKKTKATGLVQKFEKKGKEKNI